MTLRSTLALTALAVALAATPALAQRGGGGGGGSSNGDGYLNDAQRNPRYIEPGGENDPSRYRASNPSAGYDDRRAAAYGYQPRGRITVRPGY